MCCLCVLLAMCDFTDFFWILRLHDRHFQLDSSSFRLLVESTLNFDPSSSTTTSCFPPLAFPLLGVSSHPWPPWAPRPLEQPQAQAERLLYALPAALESERAEKPPWREFNGLWVFGLFMRDWLRGSLCLRRTVFRRGLSMWLWLFMRGGLRRHIGLRSSFAWSLGLMLFYCRLLRSRIESGLEPSQESEA